MTVGIAAGRVDKDYKSVRRIGRLCHTLMQVSHTICIDSFKMSQTEAVEVMAGNSAKIFIALYIDGLAKKWGKK